ncbi:hypothetical protein TNCV_245551 [Trichonephila clavipes]|nr:hypothetical protein TNCV_245551 [Trichonephila clavipes]
MLYPSVTAEAIKILAERKYVKVMKIHSGLLQGHIEKYQTASPIIVAAKISPPDPLHPINIYSKGVCSRRLLTSSLALFPVIVKRMIKAEVFTLLRSVCETPIIDFNASIEIF